MSWACRRAAAGSRGSRRAARATEYRWAGFVPASVVDPFGEELGVMYSQHDLDVLAGR